MAPLQRIHTTAQQVYDRQQVVHPAGQSVWLTSREAMTYTRRPSLHAFYMWRARRGIVTNGSGMYLRSDLERGLKLPSGRRFNGKNFRRLDDRRSSCSTVAFESVR